jgi:cytochrome c553
MKHRNRDARSCLPGICMAALVTTAGPTLAADASAGAALVGRCVACHGADGVGKAPQYPNLAGQKSAYLEKALKAYRSGERKDPNMAPMARDLSDADIENLAAYFANVE